MNAKNPADEKGESCCRHGDTSPMTCKYCKGAPWPDPASAPGELELRARAYQSGYDTAMEVRDAEVAELREALKWYADNEGNAIDGYKNTPALKEDDGKRAREALARRGEGK